MSLLLRSQLEELVGASVGVEKLQLVSLFVEGGCFTFLQDRPFYAKPDSAYSIYSPVTDVNECSAGVGLCGEEAECFNGVGTYLCRCKKDYEDHSPTKSGTLCLRAPRSGRGQSSGSAFSCSWEFFSSACASHGCSIILATCNLV